MAISDYSTTPASNTSLSGIDITGTTGKVKDGDNAIRQLMADIKAGVPYLSGTAYQIESTDAGAAAGPDYATYRNSASPAGGDLIGRYLFMGEDSAGNTETYAAIAGRISDPTSTSEDAAILIQAEIAGTLTDYLYIGANAAGTATANAVGLPLGQLSFPATQNASSGANTLDDYEEGTANATFAFATPGTSSWSYADRVIRYTKIGDLVTINCDFDVTPTIGTGSGSLSITGFPFTPVLNTPLSLSQMGGAWTWPASRTMVAAQINTGGTITILGLGSAASQVIFSASNMASGSGHTIRLSGVIKVS